MRATHAGHWMLLASTMTATLLVVPPARAEEPAAPRVPRTTVPYARPSEPVAFAEVWTDLLGRAVGRYRPRTWRGDDDSVLATFHPNHVPFAPAYAGARLVAAVRSTGKLRNVQRWLSFGLTEVAAVATTSLGTGARSLTDVFGSLAVGHASGVGAALVHPTMKRLKLGNILVSPTGVSWSGVF